MHSKPARIFAPQLQAEWILFRCQLLETLDRLDRHLAGIDQAIEQLEARTTALATRIADRLAALESSCRPLAA